MAKVDPRRSALPRPWLPAWPNCLPDERLSIRHDAGSGARPYVSDTLLAACKVLEVTGLVRDLDWLLFP